jgi:hypothetical protein
MKADEVLFWLSARHEGSWPQFRAAVEELHATEGDSSAHGINLDAPGFPIHQKLRLDLERTAHVEFFARECEVGWRVAPPTLAVHVIASGMRAVLCGARSPALRQRALQAIQSIGGEVHVHPGVPQVIRLMANELSAFNELAEQTGILVQADAPLAILSHLPPCDPPAPAQATCEFPAGPEWNIHRFDLAELAWGQVERRDIRLSRAGLFRFSHRFHRDSYFLCWREQLYRMPRANAVYILLRHARRAVLHYDPDRQTLRLPAICRPPRLLERALVLCSGLPPSYATADATLVYSDISPEIANFASELLRQPLR